MVKLPSQLPVEAPKPDEEKQQQGQQPLDSGVKQHQRDCIE